MTTVRLPVLALGAIVTLITPTDARDRFHADWGGDCGMAQCWLEIRPAKQRGTCRIRYVAADRMNADDVRCEARGSGRRTGGAVVGTISGGKPIRIRSVGSERITVSDTDDAPCGFPTRVNGTCTPIGD